MKALLLHGHPSAEHYSSHSSLLMFILLLAAAVVLFAPFAG